MPSMDMTVGAVSRTLPQPMQNGYTVEIWSRGKAHRMASGDLVRERTSATTLRRFTVEWTYLTAGQRDDVEAIVTAMLGGATATFRNPEDTTTYTVVLAEDDLPEWKVVKAIGLKEFRYSGKLKLEQVPT